MKCKNCGTELMEGIMFCPECGERNMEDRQEDESKETQGDNQAEYATTGEMLIVESTATEAEETTKSVENLIEIVNISASAEDITNQAETLKSKKYCPQCGTENTEDTLFCAQCGFSFYGATAPTLEKKKSTKKSFIIGIVAVGIVAAVGIVGFFLSDSLGRAKSDTSKLLYLKDNQINIMSGKNPIVVEDDFFDNSGSLSTSYFPIKFSEDGKYLFYPSNYMGGSYDLYRKKANSKKDDGIKIDSDIENYYLINSSKLAYIKSNEHRLYISDIEDKEKVASDVSWFKVSGDNKYIFWYTYNSEMYIQDIDLKKDKIKIDKDVDTSYYVSDDLKMILYKKDGNLYRVENYEDKERIASDVERVFTSINNDSSKIYYEKNNESVTLAIGDIVNDDLAVSDALMQEPDITNYQTTRVVDSWWGPMEKTETDDKYYEDMDEYNQKLARDSVREYLEQEMNVDCQDVYYYDIKTNTSELVFSNPIDMSTSYSGGIGVIQYYDLDEINKINMSSLMALDYMELQERIQDALRGSRRICAINGKTMVELDIDETEYGSMDSVYSCDADDVLYLLYNNKNGNDRTLFSTNVNKDNGKLKEISDEVRFIELTNKDGVYYTVSENNDYGESLYYNDKQISDEIVSGTVRATGNDQIIYFSAMRNSEGTLMMYNKGDEKEISDEVADYLVLDSSKIVLLVDYNFNKYRGDLKLYSDGKITDIDTDVTSILRY